jgi:hypothetical protein
VEIVGDLAAGSNGFRVSSYCTNGGCVEVAFRPDGTVAVRDGKARDQLPHLFTADEWRAFVAGVKAGEFDL